MNNKRIFVNFTNHPSAGWEAPQREAAEAYGNIVDVPFPVVGENASEEEILNLCNQHLSKIRALGSPQNLTVHIMGEQSFCYAMISKLQAEGIRCVASSTERDAHVNDAGQKVSAFHFTRFRDYVPPKRLCLRRGWKKQVERFRNSVSLKKNRNFFSLAALWIILLSELLLICDMQSSWFSPCILFVAAFVLLLVLYGVGRCNGHHFSIRSTIVTKLLANAVAPTALGTFYLLVFVVHIGWLTNAALGWYTAVDDEFCRVLYSTAACVGGMIALIFFFPLGKQKVGKGRYKVFISGISAINPVFKNLNPLIRILQQTSDTDTSCELFILYSDYYTNTQKQAEIEDKIDQYYKDAYNNLSEEYKSKVDKEIPKEFGMKEKLEALIKVVAMGMFPEKNWISSGLRIIFSERAVDYNQFTQCFEEVEEFVKKRDNDDTDLYFNLTPGTGIIGSLMTLMSIDGNRHLYYYSQDNRLAEDQKLEEVNKSQIPLQNLLSQALDTLADNFA